MATLIRTRAEEQSVNGRTDGSDDRFLQGSVPTPFPVECLSDLQDKHILDELAAEHVEYDAEFASPVLSSIEAVQQSCLMTLTNLLSVSLSPPSVYSSRRSSTPAMSPDSSSTSADPFLSPAEHRTKAAVASVVHALRTRDGQSTLAQSKMDLEEADEATLLGELHDLVDALAPSMDRRDAHFAQAIVALLVDLERLPPILSSTSTVLTSQDKTSLQDDTTDHSSSHVLLSTLQKQLSSLQSNTDSMDTSSRSRGTPIEVVQTALLWARIDKQLETVLVLCRDRAASQHNSVNQASLLSSGDGLLGDARAQSLDDHLPPQYESEFPYLYDMPPSYVAEPRTRASIEEKFPREDLDNSQYPPEKVSITLSLPLCEHPLREAEKGSSACLGEKSPTTPLELELVTRAIDRLYAVAPQLADQRVELKREKIMEMEKAREGKGKARASVPSCANVDVELDKMLDLLGRASAREIVDQTVVIDPRRRGRARSKADLDEQRKLHIEDLVHRSSIGRLHDQDAVRRPRHVASDSVSSLTTIPDSKSGIVYCDTTSIDSMNGEGREKPVDAKSTPFTVAFSPPPPIHKKSRSRSLSAPHIAWLKSASRERSGTSGKAKDASSNPGDRGSSSMSVVSRRLSGRSGGITGARSMLTDAEASSSGALDVAYVAEHHETLKHVLVFIACASISSSVSIQTSALSSIFATTDKPTAEVLPSNSSGTFGDWLLLRFAGKPSPPLTLPVPVIPGQKEILVQSGHWEIKVGCAQFAQDASSSEHEDTSLLTAHQLTSLSPTTFTCSSCTLPLVSSSSLKYRDLPSEHWEELVDAWMCHPEEQKLAKNGMNGSEGKGGGGFGFWPSRNEALVGGGYVLFAEGALVRDNMTVHNRNACLVRCLCGAVVGKRHEKHDNSSTMRMCRLFKYAIQPTNAITQSPNIPMSAFVVHDMLEHVQAHATYRFVLSDEEEEKPRLLIWLFKPKIRLSYMLPAPILLPKSGSIEASKVLYKILGPASATTDIRDLLKKYPGFPQAEYLFYPRDVCLKLACLLKESTESYPESLRTMTGLHVGWLRRL